MEDNQCNSNPGKWEVNGIMFDTSLRGALVRMEEI